MDGFWSVAAAGHAEFGESIVEAACRELAEELGVDAEPDDMKPLCAMHRIQGADAERDQRVDFFFECTAWTGDPKLQELDKADALEWFSINSLPTPMVPHEAEVLEGLRMGRLAPIVTHGV
jgi:8-oxo-dGTP pyrophosphatase MutT (NUDIX family)